MVVRHLLARCPVCAAAWKELRREPWSSPPADPDAYEPAFERAALLAETAAGNSQGAMGMGCSMDPDELIGEARGSLLTALARLDDLDRAIRGEALSPPRERCQVVLLSARRRSRKRPPKGRRGRRGR